MKTRFTTIDLRAAVAEIGGRLLGLRVVNVYDINNKTYLIRLAGPDVKEVLLLESGFRVHMTSFDWPKNQMPSNFSMKLRKHIRGRRLENVRQLEMDRAVDLQFGSGEAAYHLLVELYDRGNIALTDYEYTILNVLRARTDNDDVRFAVREKYPLDVARKSEDVPDESKLKEMLKDAKPGQNLKKLLNPQFVFGPALIEHCLLSAGFPSNATLGKEFDLENDIPRLIQALEEAQQYLQASGQPNCKGYIIQKKEKKPSATQEGSENAELLTYAEFHPFLFKQYENGPYIEFDSFTQSLDEFFSKQEGQKLDMKALQKEKEAIKKLDNVKKDQERRINALQKAQTLDHVKGELIEMNLPLVDEAIRVVRSAIANQIDWKEIEEIIKDAQKQGDMVAKAVKSLKLESNHFTMLLQNPYHEFDSDESENEEEEVRSKPMRVDIDLGLSAYANARRYFDLKKHSKKKEQKTVDAAEKAIKSAEKKTKQALKDVAVVTKINKTRKTYWFEKFYWFISSENYLVIAGRDKQQNEIVYKRYLTSGDVYVHADLHGASSVVIKNPSGDAVPPKTLNEAGVMAVCFSVAWDAKVITSAWWVNANQVSKTAPTGEYLTTGSFMVRGKKNYLPPVQLMMGFGFLFKLEDTCIWRHKGERKVWTNADDAMSSVTASSVGDFEDELNLDEVDDEIKTENHETSAQLKDEETEEVNLEDAETLNEREKETVNLGETGKIQIGDDKVEKDEPGRQEDGESSDDDRDADFPDTAIELRHVTGTRSRGVSMLSVSSKASSTNEDEDTIYLGDNEPIRPLEKKEGSVPGRKHLSAKQRREMKRKKKQGAESREDEEERDKDEDGTRVIAGEEEGKTVKLEEEERLQDMPEDQHSQYLEESSTQSAPLKRGQKHKMKKMKQKYRDQDEEERRLKMEILASSGAPKDNKNKKGKKGKQKIKSDNKSEEKKLPQQKHQQLMVKREAEPKEEPGGRVTDQVTKGEESSIGEVVTQGIEDINLEDVREESKRGVESVEVKHAWKDKNAVDEGLSEDEMTGVEESHFTQESASIIDSLTGCPHEDDLLLFAIPVCAPYSAMQNYKYKVKVTPGTGKKGRAAKVALNMFQMSRDCSAREKDLLKSCKDVDMSRNMPGKVKISAPNLQRAKKTGKSK
ncbi:Nuclear export mediator factor Nemf [Holothuria leucospilota]|uniref:Nuclear export mediator factor Nemf n=1 Tax=Holothuria leucospilota TaxID=206669 RepID=A0A9Q1HD22_HOLLE|nr:Nuclear export mediator factor Nemf [Holothuria leucospilota]